jgi:hypothetical protein
LSIAQGNFPFFEVNDSSACRRYAAASALSFQSPNRSEPRQAILGRSSAIFSSRKDRNAIQAELTLAEGIYKGRNVVNK